MITSWSGLGYQLDESTSLVWKSSSALKTGVVADVTRRLSAIVVVECSESRTGEETSVSLGSVGLHWVTSRGTFAFPYDFVVRADYPTKAVFILIAAIACE
jgi:hypothetical protein